MKNMCQSCGMPLSKDPKNGGTNKDGSKSDKYCSYCYKDGKFIDSCKNPQEMQKLCIDMMTKGGMPRWVAWIFTRVIPKLERWKK
ncbi:MAG: hypothetical protein HN981_05180 [Candidatus Pacebacteria bacterium]|jgi:hypothetical protein|nr:hypothetical protein [Candidatus Paceibacterota bacterium]MBT4652312.1 hypothetical protein [Candidatus Paceibacterota bacterium]MBT6756139.1 hypothetical protein [Candidatus Paceibacterota bacterium]MBT6921756.1 hypothetical protein [Candidatus Paceibacterota bacterium]